MIGYMTDGDFHIRMPSGTDDPLSDAEIQTYREEINRLDKIIRESIHRRTEVSRAIGKTRLTSGGTKLVHTREVAIINQFREEFGTEGVQIALDTDDLPAGVQGVLGATGVATHAPAFDGTITVPFGAGIVNVKLSNSARGRLADVTPHMTMPT